MELILLSVLLWVALSGLTYALGVKFSARYIQNKGLWWGVLAVTFVPWIPLEHMEQHNAIPAVLFNANLQQFAEPLLAMTKRTQVASDWLNLTLMAVFMVYCVGLITHLLVLGRQFWRVKRLCSTASKIKLGTRSCYQLPITCSPFVFGLWQPKVYLPVEFDTLPEAEQQALILHELTHIDKGDHIAVVIWRILTTLAWFNPFIAKMELGFIRAMEYRCDEVTIAKHSLEPLAYSKALMNSLKRAAAPPETMNMTASFASNSLTLDDYKKRFSVILKSKKKPSNLVLIGVFVLLSSGLAYGNIQWTMGTAMVSKTWTYPVVTPEITSRFGHVSNFRHNKAHQGLDLAGGVGEPAMAVASGMVTIADDKTLPENYGKVVLIHHDNGYQSLYAHLDSIDVAVGEQVSQGEVIGTIGETGRVTGPHLHLEALHNNTRIDPLTLLEN
ncbi:M23/M56 family metallopeptidase [Pseudoalteromonas sp. Isolate6]|uniref:M23/M56 family metallopeptidase n=1 Tax=Pseudoalteromonas sp. Isolate6 TaxID=2908527 RepID=UPI001EFE329B|nr:M23/M56 family metallopeptidase [Pseudoalteromonas sp. Isolate6]MCG9757769.1 M23/M56 family metallopeptidase [Pseudoalteromonas sp. Isolate6]